jgi:hypothetical protein
VSDTHTPAGDDPAMLAAGRILAAGTGLAAACEWAAGELETAAGDGDILPDFVLAVAEELRAALRAVREAGR